MALPKRRTSKSKRDMRSANKRLLPPTLVNCPECSEPMKPHHVCLECGYYKGRQIIEKEESSTK